MMKTTTLLAAALALLPAMAAAEPPKPQTMTYDGVTYTYTVIEKNGIRKIDGMMDKGFKRFSLVVGKHFVDGTVGGTPVSFSLKAVKPLIGTVEVASR
jgi:hypothetical protein